MKRAFGEPHIFLSTTGSGSSAEAGFQAPDRFARVIHTPAGGGISSEQIWIGQRSWTRLDDRSPWREIANPQPAPYLSAPFLGVSSLDGVTVSATDVGCRFASAEGVLETNADGLPASMTLSSETTTFDYDREIEISEPS